MKKILIIAIISPLLFLVSCDDSFLNINPNDSITDEAVWASSTSTKLFVNEVYNSVLQGPLYNLGTGCSNWWSFDHAYTDDMGISLVSYNEFSFTASNQDGLIRGRWAECYSSIRKTNIALKKIPESTFLTIDQKKRYEGDMYFLRGLLYLELWRFWGGVPLIDKPLNRFEDDIFIGRSTSEETYNHIINDFDSAATRLPVTIPAAEYGRATKGAVLGFKAVACLHAGGVLDSKYYQDAADVAEKFITGELKDRYQLFGKDVTDPAKKATTFANLFLEPNEGNSEVIFDVQYANPMRTQGGYQTIAAPGYPGKNNDYGWGGSAPSQMIVDAFEMKDGNAFDWSNPTQAAAPYENRDARFYASILYNGIVWKDSVLSLSSNRYVKNGSRWTKVTDNLPNGLYSSKTERTKTGYFLRKHQNETVKCGLTNRYGNKDGEGGNFIVLRLAEILLTYAEAKNEVSGPDASVYEAVNRVRRRAGQPDLPSGLGQDQMRERIRNERRVELCFENKRYFDIIRWKAGMTYLNQPFYGMNITYELVSNVPVAKYTRFVYFQKKFDPNKNYLFPIPQSAISTNPKLEGQQNPGW